jgi:metal-responsive CopG/Arc/MetJ family transcriptional regulator
MSHSKISVTVPDEVLEEVKRMASDRDIKISRLITEALADKVKQNREESFVSKINKVFEDTKILEEQHSMAEDIANNSDIKELKW